MQRTIFSTMDARACAGQSGVPAGCWPAHLMAGEPAHAAGGCWRHGVPHTQIAGAATGSTAAVHAAPAHNKHAAGAAHKVHCAALLAEGLQAKQLGGNT